MDSPSKSPESPESPESPSMDRPIPPRCPFADLWNLPGVGNPPLDHVHSNAHRHPRMDSPPKSPKSPESPGSPRSLSMDLPSPLRCPLADRWNLPGLGNPPLDHVPLCSQCRLKLCHDIQDLLVSAAGTIQTAATDLGLQGSTHSLLYYRQVLSVLHQLNMAIMRGRNFDSVRPLEPLLLDPLRPASPADLATATEPTSEPTNEPTAATVTEPTETRTPSSSSVPAPETPASQSTTPPQPTPMDEEVARAIRIALIAQYRAIIGRWVRMIATNVCVRDEMYIVEVRWSYAIGTVDALPVS